MAEFTGLRPEPELRQFIKGLEPAASDLDTGRANHLLAGEKWPQAEAIFHKTLDDNPDHPGALLGLARSLLAQGLAAQALPILREFPVSKEYAEAERLLPLAQAEADWELGEAEQAKDEEGAGAMYANALRLASQGSLLPAMDGLLDVLRQDKNFQKGKARQVFLGMLAVLGEDNPATRQYRSELATLLF